MVQELRPMLISAVREVVTEGVRAYMRSKTADLIPTPRAERVTIIDVTPNETDCPYCDVVLYLSSAHYYLTRSQSRPSFASLYRSLARHRVAEASRVGKRLRASMENLLIQRELRALEDSLRDDASVPLSSAQSSMSSLMDRAMDLAEKSETNR
jgi:hypothetical protein